MKTIATLVIFLIIAPFLWADDWETFEIINRLVTIREPGAPLIYENVVIFTADSTLRRVGISFAHENFSTVYWYRQLMVPQDRLNAPIPPGQKVPDPFIDSGVKFHVFQIPENMRELEYRLIINGLWLTDPVNPITRRDPVSGLSLSVLSLPYRPVRHNPLNSLPEGVTFMYNAPSGETITIAGTFNNWDPYMYEMREGPAGVYRITIPLPSGPHQYAFYHRGERFTDPENPIRVYSRERGAASEITVP
jgi:hypothetical protein